MEKKTTSSTMTIEDEKPKAFVNRQHGRDEERWCMIVPDKEHQPAPGFKIVLQQGKVTVEFMTFYKLTRKEHSELQTHCADRRCKLITLPAGYTPKDLQVRGR